jgi:6-phosphogluconate dehydrogenase
MNERIKELAEQAALLGPSSRVGNAHEATEKFAELIVRECAKIADIADENECEWIGGNILTRFGVEE